MNEVIAIIPARSGSKSIIDKNSNDTDLIYMYIIKKKLIFLIFRRKISDEKGLKRPFLDHETQVQCSSI